MTARFRTRATGDVTPTNVNYRLVCLTTGADLVPWTSVTPGTSVTITVTPTQNKIQDVCDYIERKELSVAADYGLSTQFIESFEYEIVNVSGAI